MSHRPSRPPSARPAGRDNHQNRDPAARPTRPQSATTRQRGFYSECLDSQIELDSANQLLLAASCGPRELDLQPKLAAPRQRLPVKAQFFGMDNEAFAKATERVQKRVQLAGRASAPSRAVEPKVLVPFSTRPGQVPRRIVIERQKRLFALQDLAQLLLDHGVDSAVSDPPNALPLEVFDDTEYESRPIDEWLSMGEETDDGSRFLPARFLRPPAEAGRPAVWTDCQVQSYDEVTRRFQVLYKEHAGYRAEILTSHAPRIGLCFKAEDPFVFRDRVVAAHGAREAAEAAVRHSLILESMPTEGLPPIEKERINRMLALALNTERLKQMQLNASSLISEVTIDYARTMSAIIFEGRYGSYEASKRAAPFEGRSLVWSDPEGDQIFGGLAVAAPPAKKAAPELGQVEMPPHDVPEQRREFAFHTLLSKSEIIGCAHKVRSECNRVLGMSLFATGYTKSVSDEEFRATQEQALSATVSYLRDTWTKALKDAVKTSLKDVGKGWFNLYETSTEVYAMSKLRRFLRMINLMMQDSLVTMAEGSVKAYEALIVERCSYKVVVTSPSEVDVSPVGTAVYNAFLPPLFFTELVAVDGEGIVYRTEPEAFVRAVLERYDKASASVQDLPQLEKFVMEGLFWSDTPMLQTIATHEGVTPECRASFHEALLSALPPMHAYVKLYERYASVVQMSVPQYVVEYTANDRSIAEMSLDVKKQRALIADVERDVPLSVSVGLFSVSTAQVRKFVVERHQAMASAILTLIARKVKARGEELTQAFADIDRALSRATPDIEAVAELEEYMSQLPMELEALQQGLQEMLAEQLILEDFECAPHPTALGSYAPPTDPVF